MPFAIVRQDITKMKVDAIVNAANTDLQRGGGVCGAIFEAAGEHELQNSCDRLAPIMTGEAVITPGFALSSKYIIHAAGPVYDRRDAQQSENLLRKTYINSLKLAVKHKCESVAFPLISSGVYGYPKDEALRVATSAIQEFISDHEMDVFLIVFDREAFTVSEKLLGEVASYIDEYYVEEHYEKRLSQRKTDEILLSESMHVQYNAPTQDIDDFVKNLDEPFSSTILRLIDAKGKTDVEVYKSANLDRKLFSKIRTDKAYMPSKRTAIALAVALELSLDETDDLLERAGFALSHSRMSDVIVEYFIINRMYDIYAINEVLFKYDQPLLGG